MIAIHWFRRDLRIDDNAALTEALEGNIPVLPLFIFDSTIVSELPSYDPRITFIYERLGTLHSTCNEYGSGIIVRDGNPLEVWSALLSEFPIKAVYFNKDYEPSAIQRDSTVTEMLKENGVEVFSYKDQVIFEEKEILKKDGTPYTVFTPYKKQWLLRFKDMGLSNQENPILTNLHPYREPLPSIESIGFKPSTIKVRTYDLSRVTEYESLRNLPAREGTSDISPHLRFGTVSIRNIVRQTAGLSEVFLSELIWREFFMQILYHFPTVVTKNFRAKYDGIQWRNDPEEFDRWRNGQTGYPMVDAGMRELNQTGYMHNRVRMITASFLCKHLLIDWRWGEAYFAEKLLDYELSSNNGNWQWVAGTGCDAAPYFRIFNPIEQLKKFDPDNEYIRKWIPELDGFDYPSPMVDHPLARKRALEAYRIGTQ